MIDGRPIVVGVDGSSGSADAVRWAAGEASRRQAPLRVVHATTPTHLPAMRSTAVGATTGWMDDAERAAADGVEAARRSHPSITVESKVYLNETPARGLAAESESAALVVLGARGRGGFPGLQLGSTAVKVIEVALGPVVVVRGSGTATAGAGITVGVDGSEPSGRALRFALEEAVLHATDVTALHAGTKPSAPPFVDAVAAAAADFPDVRLTQRLVNDRPADALVEASQDAGLLVVGSRGYGRLVGRVLGSVSHAVIHRASCPVAVVR